MPSRLSAFVIWALVAAAAVFWGLRLMVSPAAAPAGAVAVDESVAMGGDLNRLFGAPLAAVAEEVLPVNNRFKLIGVMAGRQTPEGTAPGIALISIDDKPARPFMAGSRVEDQLVLKTVSQRSASLGPALGPASFVLEIPLLPPPATGTLDVAPGIEAPLEPVESSPVISEPPEQAPQLAPRPARPMPGRPR
jgi:general secretion pathway protein C